MRSIVDWVLCAAFPLVLAAAKGKRKSVKKRVKRPAPAGRSRIRRSRVNRPHVQRARAKKAARASKRSARRVPSARQASVRARPPLRDVRGRQAGARVRPPLHPPVVPAAVSKPVEPEPPPKPVPPIGRAILLSPENEKFVDSFHPTFRWLSVGGAARYEIAWGEDAALTASRTILSIATEATVPVEESLRLGVTYYWRVRGGNESGWGPWSATASFHVLEERA